MEEREKSRIGKKGPSDLLKEKKKNKPTVEKKK